MARGRSRRALLVIVVLAAALGFLAGWAARRWYRATPGDRARGAVEDIRGRVRELTR